MVFCVSLHETCNPTIGKVAGEMASVSASGRMGVGTGRSYKGKTEQVT